MKTRRRYLLYAAANAFPHGKCGDNAKWKLINGVLTISGTGSLYNRDSVSLGFAQYAGDIKSLVIEDGITQLYGSNFKNLSSIETISFGPSLTNMGNNTTFQGCSSLERIDFNGTFNEWNLGTKSSLFAANNNNKYLYCNGVYLPALLELPDVVTIGPSTYRTLGNLEKVIIGDNCTTIGISAFQNCGNLTEVELGNSVATIESSAFYGTPLTEINLPLSLVSIGSNAFTYTQITRVNYPGTQTQYDAISHVARFPQGFRLYCNNVEAEDIIVANSTLRVAYAGCASVKTARIMASVENVLDNAFTQCANLTTVTFEGTPTLGGTHIFANCPLLTNIYVPWSEGAVAGAPWGAINATITYDYTGA